ncbi:MAG: glycosyltransferase [Candidatus Lokiarchaeota archaeon]|nr:glycosyltransferase [Candidatus Lokiarchaeota archaeon]MBD3201727.1 glycosyltransferase [Candidatus Lokiarchaeota archaeon]
MKESIWLLTFEYAGIAKAGGLGEVPANQAKSLVDHFDFTVFIPSHGQISRLKLNKDITKLSLICKGFFNPEDVGLDFRSGEYEISYYQMQLDGVNFILISGENEFTSSFLGDNIVYNPDTFNGKLALFSIGIRYYMSQIIKKSPERLPKLLHLHDYHSVIPSICMKQVLFKNKIYIPSIITIHLLTWPRHSIEFIKACGVNSSPIEIFLKEGYKSLTIEEIFRLCEKSEEVKLKRISKPSLEMIGAVISDLVISVSENYLKNEVIPNLGGDLIEFKSDFVWNGCDWDYEKMYNGVVEDLGDEISEFYGEGSNLNFSREALREYLLTYKIGNLNESPLINSKKVLNTINEISNGNPFIKNGRIRAFKESGPLALTTGRISKQKGFDLILESIPKIIEVIPNAKFLFLLLPNEYNIEEIKTYAEYVKKFPNNIRIIFGVAKDIFNLAHISADVYCAISRWEPFGIIALEAMASKLPVIATKVGGLQESVIDVRKYPENGTGILIEKDNTFQLINALISIFKMQKISSKQPLKNHYTDLDNYIESIPDHKIVEILKSNPYIYEKLQSNCIDRVENNFRWNIVSQKLRILYESLTE